MSAQALLTYTKAGKGKATEVPSLEGQHVIIALSLGVNLFVYVVTFCGSLAVYIDLPTIQGTDLKQDMIMSSVIYAGIFAHRLFC